MRCHFHHAGLQVLTCCALFFGTSVSLSAQGCESLFTHNLLPQGVIDPGIDPSGSPTFTDQGIELVFDFFDPGGGPVYGSASSLDATPEFGFTRILALNDISAVYTLSQALPPGSTIQQVIVEFNDLNPNPEEIRINGAPPVFWNITDLMSAPNLPLAPGVEVQVDMMPGSSTVGKLILTGDLGEIKLGGTNLQLDDVCINPDGDPNGGGGGIPGCTYEVAINFDPNATIDNGSCQFDFGGGNPCENDSDDDGVCDEDEIPGCTGPCSCNYNPEATDDDGSCLDSDAIGMCGGDCLSDLDADGVCDDQDPCIGFVDECGVCNGPGATLPCGCSDIPPGACDCEGNLIDAFGICGGTCPTDLDGDGECDDVDCCIGGYDECGVCNGPGPVFDCGCEMMPLGACDCQGNQLDALGVCGGDCPSDLDGDGVCDVFDDCIGFYDACGVCNGPGPIFTCGCFMQPLADCDCEGNQLDALGICGGDCTSDLDGDGICDSNEIPGCTNPEACNYNPQATDDNGTCEFAPEDLNCDLTCINDIDQDGICDDDEVLGCMDETACNYFPPATDDVGCLYPSFGYDCQGNCINDADDDGVCDANEIVGCTDQDACNFLPEATDESGTCVYATALYDCNGDCISDQDGDGICDGQEILGCLDQTACNYNPNATSLDPNLPCLFPVAGYNCLGECTQDVNDNGICDFLEESGCTDPTACNYNPSATSLDPNLPCLFPIPGYNCNGEGIVFGCMDPMACNFNPDATNSANANCEFAPPGFGCDGQCLDFDDDGVCNLDEINGCTYVDAENFNADATEDDGTCTFPEGPGESGCPDIDGDGTVAIGDLLELLGQFGEESDC